MEILLSRYERRLVYFVWASTSILGGFTAKKPLIPLAGIQGSETNYSCNAGESWQLFYSMEVLLGIFSMEVFRLQILLLS